MLFGYLLFRAWQNKAVRRFGSSEMLEQLSPESSVFKGWLKQSFLLLGCAALVLALVNPKVGTELETVKREGVDLVFAIDVSKSMLAEDIAPNRLDKNITWKSYDNKTAVFVLLIQSLQFFVLRCQTTFRSGVDDHDFLAFKRAEIKIVSVDVGNDKLVNACVHIVCLGLKGGDYTTENPDPCRNLFHSFSCKSIKSIIS